MKKILKTTIVVSAIYLIAIGAAFIMSARVERLDKVDTTSLISSH